MTYLWAVGTPSGILMSGTYFHLRLSPLVISLP
ncbi:hypothetical protein Zm00014a_006753 [Zea mays]|uniref:Uncharacterized protein n=1 Tax=Zea mays TaxID=4577 RepID=A0A3L6DDC4_MAIZE|nr:hypothetical protein Zm00014a_006753 [Zea mays]